MSEKIFLYYFLNCPTFVAKTAYIYRLYINIENKSFPRPRNTRVEKNGIDMDVGDAGVAETKNFYGFPDFWHIICYRLSLVATLFFATLSALA